MWYINSFSAKISTMKKNPHSSAFFSLKIIFIKSVVICVNLWLIFNFLSCTKKLTPEELEAQRLLAEAEREESIQNAKNAAVSEYVASLSDEVKISQLFLVNIEGSERYHAVEKTGSLYGNPEEGTPLVPGGVLLFSYNVSKDPLETYEYIKSIRDFYLANENLPPFVAVDQEGGDVNRLRGLTSVLWSEKKVADSFSLEGAAELYSAQARQMKNLGFHMNLAPVVEVLTEKNKDFLDTRSFGNLEDTLSYGKNVVTGYESNGIAVVLKHFPGNSSTDPHTGLPEIRLTRAELEQNYIAPFRSLLADSSALLMSHARMTLTDDEQYADSKTPACLSKYWVHDMVRSELGFSGLVLSDDIFMGALAENGYPPETAAFEALCAGIDVIMLSEKRFGRVAGIILSKAKEDAGFASEVNRAVENVIRFKISAGILTLKEMSDGGDGEIPRFAVEVTDTYEDFDLHKFNEDYKAGMNAYELSK